MKTNSQLMLSGRIQLGDLDGDGVDELIEIDGRRIDVFKPTYDHSPLLTHVYPHPVKRLIVGDFVARGREHGRDQVLAILSDGSLHAHAISNDLSELWWWFTQRSPLADADHFIVGDFDGDGADEILVYRSTSGRIRLVERKRSGYFEDASNYSIGNLRSHDRKGKLLIAGHFGQAAARTDLLLVDRSRGQVARFDTATDDDGVNTFWWAFTSKAGLFAKNDDLAVANLDGGNEDSLVIRRANDGSYRFFDLEYNNGNLRRRSDVAAGQLPKDQRSRIVAARVRDLRYRRERGGARRHDIVTFDDRTLQLVRTDARFDRRRSRLTYWWAHSANFVVEPDRTATKRPWAIILCQFRGSAASPAMETYFREIFTPGSGGLIEYWHDVSLGAIDVSGSRVFGFVQLPIRRAEAAGKNREELIDIAIGAARRARIEPVRGFHSQIAVFTHDFSRDGAPAGANWRDPTWGQFWIDGSADRKGRVSAPPHAQSGSFLAHEMGHGMDFDHDLAANLRSHYGDPNCIMSAMRVRSFQDPQWGRQFGPSMSAPQLDIKGFMFDRRVLKLPRTWTSAPKSFNMAPLSDRRQDAYLAAIVPVGRSARWSYELEYMVPTEWNQGLAQPRLVVRRRVGNTAAYLLDIPVPTTRGRSASRTEGSGSVEFTVKRTRTDARQIEVRVRKT